MVRISVRGRWSLPVLHELSLTYVACRLVTASGLVDRSGGVVLFRPGNDATTC